MLLKEDVFKLSIRREIYNFINNNQGLNIREISRKLNIPKSTLIYHINYLKKIGIIKEKIEGKSKRIFITDKIGKKDKEILLLLRKKIPRRIFLYLIFSCAFSQSDLCKELELDPATVHYHINKLIKMGVIEEAKIKDGCVFPFKSSIHIDWYIKRKPIGSEKFYIRKNQQIIDDTYRVLITHKSSLSDEEIIDSYMDLLYEIKIFVEKLKKDGKKISKKFPDINEKLFSYLDFIYEELFRPPFAY